MCPYTYLWPSRRVSVTRALASRLFRALRRRAGRTANGCGGGLGVQVITVRLVRLWEDEPLLFERPYEQAPRQIRTASPLFLRPLIERGQNRSRDAEAKLPGQVFWFLFFHNGW